jgi:hypothetical protein
VTADESNDLRCTGTYSMGTETMDKMSKKFESGSSKQEISKGVVV